MVVDVRRISRYCSKLPVNANGKWYTEAYNVTLLVPQRNLSVREEGANVRAMRYASVCVCIDWVKQL